MMLGMDMMGGGRRLPRNGLLLYLARPNSDEYLVGEDTEVGEDTYIWGYALPDDADIRSATGWVSGTANVFYTATGVPIVALATEIAAAIDHLPLEVVFSLVNATTQTGRLAIYAPGTSDTVLARAYAVLRYELALPSSGLLLNTGTTPETIGATTVIRSSLPLNANPTVQQVKGSGFAGAGSATVAGLLTTDTITATGDAPTCTVDGVLTFPGSDCWDVYVHRGGVLWAYWPGINVGRITELDASGNGHHLAALTNTAITEWVDGSGTNHHNSRTVASSWGNIVYDPSGSLTNILSKINTEHVDFAAIGDSNQLKDATGWDQGFHKALSSRWPMYATGVISPNENNGNGAGVGYLYSKVANIGQWTGAPDFYKSHLNTDASGGSPHNYAYIPSGTDVTVSVPSGIGVNVSCDLDIKGPLKCRVYHGTFSDGAGDFRPSVRLGVSPYTILNYGNVVSSSTGVASITSTEISLPADAGRTSSLEFMITRPGLTIHGPLFITFLYVKNTSRTFGYSFNEFMALGGWSARDHAARLQSASDSEIIHFFDVLRDKQSQASKNIVVMINLGLNDRNETEASIPSLITPGDSKAAYKDNLQYIIDRISAVYPGELEELHFVLAPSHPVATPDDIELTKYRAAALELCNENPQTSFINIEAITDNQYISARNWYHSGGADVDHLVGDGYDGVAGLIIDSIVETSTMVPLRADLTVTAGTTYPNLTVTAPLGPEFQAITEWTGGAAVDLSALVATANTRKGQLGVAIYSPGLDAAGIVRADKVLKA